MNLKKETIYSLVPSSLILVAIIFCFGMGIVNAQDNDTKNIEAELEQINKCNRECGDNIYINSLSPDLIDKSGIINQEEEQLKLDSFFRTLANKPNSRGFIVVYGGKQNKYGEIDARIKRIKDYGTLRNYPPDLIKFVLGGFREKFEFEFWVSRVPNAFPPLSPTVSPEKVTFKGKMKPFVNRL